VQLVAAPAAARPGRTGYVIGRKVSTRAVDRNRIRRKLREVIRPLRPVLVGYDLIVRVKRAANRVEQDAAVLEAQALLATLTGGARP
jgi:ribonuclease P protein component